MNVLTAIIVASLVNCFVVQLLVKDRIFATPRERFYGWLLGRDDAGVIHNLRGFKRWLHDMTSCQRCFGVWTSLPVTWLVLWMAPWTDLRIFVIVMFAASFTQWAIMQLVDTWESE